MYKECISKALQKMIQWKKKEKTEIRNPRITTWARDIQQKSCHLVYKTAKKALTRCIIHLFLRLSPSRGPQYNPISNNAGDAGTTSESSARDWRLLPVSRP